MKTVEVDRAPQRRTPLIILLLSLPIKLLNVLIQILGCILYYPTYVLLLLIKVLASDYNDI